MMTVNEVSKLTGVSIRALQYYDKIGLLRPTGYTESGYRLYDDTALETLQQILLFRELEFPLKEIKEIISRPDFDRKKALEQQIKLLTMKKERLENLISFAREIQIKGVMTMDFSVFDTKKLDEYAMQAKEQWGKTVEYKEFEQKSAGRSKEEEKAVAKKFMQIFADFGNLKDSAPESDAVQQQVKGLQDYITQHYYQCSDEILYSLGQMYACDGEFTENIDRAGGEGTAKFVTEAIRIYCAK
ncbi:MAG: MerR family transcriptional regulator [Lachnospiraceae bacterium]|nr:MerR family transcriptional regulator [Lachnospiraceae bacterium]